jgi:hypothetical protein
VKASGLARKYRRSGGAPKPELADREFQAIQNADVEIRRRSEREVETSSFAFYEASLAPLNIKFFMPYKGENGHPDLWEFGDGKRAFFWLKQGKPDPQAIHWGFMAGNNAKVDEFYKAAIAAGAKDNISPRARLEYYPGYYAPDVFDPDGYSFEVVHKS